jgi:metallo-beta-lactamase class B
MNLRRPSNNSWLNPVLVLLFLAASVPLFAKTSFETPAWTAPVAPFHIAGNLYYVGSQDLAAYLLVTPQGDILINSNLESSVPQILKSIETLGFHPSDVKILLISHAHFDHCAGSAALLKLTGAKYYVMDADVSVVESGGKTDFAYANEPEMHFPPVKVDRILHDGDTVSLGGTVLTAHLTPGHTRGDTTWTVNETEAGRTLRAVIIGSPNVNTGYKLVGNSVYPAIASDYERGFAVLHSLPCDLFLGAHGGYFGLVAKLPRYQAGDHDVFIDPAGYKAYIDEREHAFQTELARQKAGK